MLHPALHTVLRSVRSGLAPVVGRSAAGRSVAERDARRALARELSDVTAAGRTELTLLAADAPAGAEVVGILRGQATRRLLVAG